MTERIQNGIAIPLDGIEADPASGRACARLDGVLQRVAFHVDQGVWRLLEGAPGRRRLGPVVQADGAGHWAVTSSEQSRRHMAPAVSIERLALPPVPVISALAMPIPRLIHYVWIGENGIPEKLARNILGNAARSIGFRTVVHVHAQTAAGLDRVTRQLSGSAIVINDLTVSTDFQRFMGSSLAPWFLMFLEAPTRNYGAASDMLRMFLLHAYGGIYMDCDDTIAAPFPADTAPIAAATDLLVNAMISAPSAEFAGYNQSNFACHAGNPLLVEILSQMVMRLQSARTFLSTPRPWRSADADDPRQRDALDAYVMKILELTGPSIFSDVLKMRRPDYYAIESALLHAYQAMNYEPGEPRVVADAYLQSLRAAKAHYMPFAEAPYEITVGNADSWNVQIPEPGAPE